MVSAGRPSLAGFYGRLYMAFQGGPGDNSLWWSVFDGYTWAGPARVPVTSTNAPSLAEYNGPGYNGFNGPLYMAWHGGPGDNSLWWSSAS